MTIDEAIKVLRQHNVKGASVLRITKGQALEKDLLAQVLDSCEQLISERAEYKRLLKMAVNDMRDVANNSCCSRCVFDELDIQGSCCAEGCFKWRYADEALKLIGDEK